MESQKYVQQRQQETIRDIELARPKYLISVAMEDSRLEQPGSDPRIFTWAHDYTGRYYDAVGFVNMVTPDRFDYYFGEVPKSVPCWGIIF